MKIMQKIMIAVALLGSFALATPAQAGEYWGCHHYHHWHHYECRPHYYYHCWHHYECQPHYYYHCWHHHYHHCW